SNDGPARSHHPRPGRRRLRRARRDDGRDRRGLLAHVGLGDVVDAIRARRTTRHLLARHAVLWPFGRRSRALRRLPCPDALSASECVRSCGPPPPPVHPPPPRRPSLVDGASRPVRPWLIARGPRVLG